MKITPAHSNGRQAVWSCQTDSFLKALESRKTVVLPVSLISTLSNDRNK